MVFGFLPIGLAYQAAIPFWRRDDGGVGGKFAGRSILKSRTRRQMIPVVVILVYLALIALIGSVAFKRSKEKHRGFLPGQPFHRPDGFLPVDFRHQHDRLRHPGQFRAGLPAGHRHLWFDGFVLLLCHSADDFFIGTRLWALGKKFGHQTQVSFFRDRWECNHIGTVIFALSAAMLVPYMIISIMGGGTVLADISTSAETHQPLIPTLGLRDCGGGGDAECFPRRHARDGLGEHLQTIFSSVSAPWRWRSSAMPCLWASAITWEKWPRTRR
jgi:hypothetical protein